MNRKFLILLSTLISSYSISCLAKDVTVFKWVDDRGIVHYGQHEPMHNDFTELKVETSYSPIQAPLNNNVVDKDDDKNSIDIASVSSIQCKNAQANLRTLNDFEKIEVTDSNGKSRVLSEMEKMKQTRLSEKEIEIYCEQ